MKAKLFLLAFRVLAIVASCSSVLAADYYVSPNGNDTDPGTLAKPWQSISTSVTKLTAGD
jgi:hypothetical protein